METSKDEKRKRKRRGSCLSVFWKGQEEDREDSERRKRVQRQGEKKETEGRCRERRKGER